MGPSKKQWAKIHDRAQRWAKALKMASDEHGRPNRFNVMELCRAVEYVRLEPREGYYLGHCRLDMLWAELGGREGWGSRPTYSKGWFYV